MEEKGWRYYYGNIRNSLVMEEGEKEKEIERLIAGRVKQERGMEECRGICKREYGEQA